MKENLLAPLRKLGGYRAVVEALGGGVPAAAVGGLVGAARAHVAAGVISELGACAAVVVAPGEKAARMLYEDLRYFTDRARYYPHKDIVFYGADTRSINIMRERLLVLDAVMRGEGPVIVLTAEALLDRLSPSSAFAQRVLELSPGQAWDIPGLCARLLAMGYERVSMIEGPGQFAQRGGILDVYTPLYESAIRLEFWDDELDSIRLLDTVSQRSVDRLEGARIFPVREFLPSLGELAAACKALRKELGAARAVAEKEAGADNFRVIEEQLEALENGTDLRVAERYPAHFQTATLLDYLPQGSLIVFEEPAKLAEHMGVVLEEFAQSMADKQARGLALPSQAQSHGLGWDGVLARARAFQSLVMMNLGQGMDGFPGAPYFELNTRELGVQELGSETTAESLRKNVERGWRTLVLCMSRTKAQRMAEELRLRGITAVYTEEAGGQELPGGAVVVAPGSMSKGFEYPEAGFALLSDREAIRKRRLRKRRRTKGRAIDSFAELSAGDLIVHDNHGVGVFKGIERITTDDIVRDYLKILYADDGVLYVPTSQMDIVQKYIGGEGAKLNKLGGADWARAKSRAKKAASILAKDLVLLYAQRNAANGYAFSPDNVWQAEFEELFPYEETEDQLAAIEDVKRDMEAPRVMDRLICGDVGYGKTEIALRAAFKAVQDSKQVAYLVPTTILAQQHYNSFVQRMGAYPIKVEMLSRFKSHKQQAETLHRLRSGECDIVIGTHRLLSKDIAFNELGLLIVDEEQRFGVAHKEKIKLLRADVDVLTLTATPIPRTLHMSLNGIRDMSILEEPPSERQPVQTYVMEYNPSYVRDALRRELARSGQVFYLNNRVRNIAEVAARVQELVPEARVAYAHGQMSEAELAGIMAEFIAGEVDVLVCTTIIETGLDIPNANTMIIQDADFYGLAQLYQLRGRVGRSNRQAYAYFMYRRDRILRDNAQKRLQTIREFTEFGAGFRIAMRDMELRGAGNLLGEEQHGDMEAVGYEMYCRLLDEAVQELSENGEVSLLPEGGGKSAANSIETSVELDVDAYIPPKYVPDEAQKLDVYKKISLIRTEQDFYDIQEELEDRFGTIPRPVANLLEIALLKALAGRAGVVSVGMRGGGVAMTFAGDAKVDPELLLGQIAKSRGRLGFKAAVNPIVTYTNSKGIDLREMHEFLKSVV